MKRKNIKRKKKVRKEYFVNKEMKERFLRIIRNKFGVVAGNEVWFVSVITGINIDWENLTKGQLRILIEELKSNLL